jgi:3-deoxy-manno-octulosonate cytidylyltransferase (CMP-KDO synthetase)
MNKTLIMIPARLGSTRFPNKPLADINGKTMIVRVCEQAAKIKNAEIIVACSEIEVKTEVEKAGFRAIMTDPNLPSGTDRINAALKEVNSSADLIVNLQGDLPNIDPSVIKDTIEVLEIDSKTDIATAVVEIDEDRVRDDPNVVKAVVNFSENQKISTAHYFSRLPVPYNAPKHYEHIGIYVYRKKALEKFVSLSESYFEKYEKLEQLRAIENGMKISACLIDNDLKPVSVDTKEDLEKLLKL